MDTRARIAIGGTTAFAVSAAVVATVAVTNAAVLSESPAVPVNAVAVDIRPAPQVSVTPPPVAGPADVSSVTEPVTEPAVEQPAPAPAPVGPSPVAPPAEGSSPVAPVVVSPPPVARTVPAPAPVVIAPEQPVPAPMVPGPMVPAAGAEAHDSDDRAQLDFGQDADGRGDRGGREDRPGRYSDMSPVSPRPQPSASAVNPSVPETPLYRDGSKRDRSHGSPDPRD